MPPQISDELVKKAIEAEENILKDPKASAALRFKVAQDILDRGGVPKRREETVRTQKLITGNVREVRRAVEAEFIEVTQELKQLEDAGE